MIRFLGAGPGDPELLTIKAARLLHEADVVVHAGSLVNPAILEHCRAGAELHDSAGMTLDEIMAVMVSAARAGKRVARLHTGDPSLYGATLEQMLALERAGIEFEVVPGVTAVFAAAAALKIERTVPGLVQSLVIGRAAGRTPVPERESLENLAAIGATLALYLSAAHLATATADLIKGGYRPDTPAAVVYRAGWPDERIITGTLSDIADSVEQAGITRHALVLAGDALARQLPEGASKLYDGSFSHGFRDAE